MAVDSVSGIASASSGFTNSSAALFAQDLLLAFPRLAQRAGTFAVNYLPEQLDGLFQIAKGSGSAIADATSSTVASNTSILPSGTSIMTTASPSSTTFASSIFSFGTNFSIPDLSKVDGFFTYLASRWALSTAIMAIILNRTYVYAYSRRALRFNLKTRLVVRTIPILLFILQIRNLLQAIRCQTGSFIETAAFEPQHAILNADLTSDAPNMHWLSSKLIFWQTEQESCAAVGMMPGVRGRAAALGSSSLLWPLFLSFCLSHFIETISCALRSQIPVAETGMTIFEHSLAFAEAEAGMRTSVGLTMFGLPRTATQTTTSLTASPSATSVAEATGMTLTRSLITQRLNAPPEMLLISLVSAANHLSSHLLGLLGLQTRFRLINTTIWGVCYMSVFLTSFIDAFRFVTGNTSGFPRLPTVCMIGFIPHLMIVSGVIICGVVYGIALLLTLLSQQHGNNRDQPLSLSQRLRIAYSNLQANTFLTNIHINWHDEFYTFLLKLGWTMMTAASEAVYFNEGTSLTVTPRTWLEEKRFQEVSEQHRRKTTTDHFRSQIPQELHSSFDLPADIGLIDEGEPTTSGYSRERRTMKKDTRAVTYSRSDEGVGGSQRGARIYLSFKFLKGCLELSTWTMARFSIALLNKLRVRSHPRWLVKLAKLDKRSRNGLKQTSLRARSGRYLSFWMIADDGTLHLPSDGNVDVEVETRRRMEMAGERHDASESALDANLYGWWKQGGWWGDVDSSGDYIPRGDTEDEDTTSVISESTIASHETASNAEEDDDEGTTSGQRTPTQHSVLSRDTTPFDDSTLSNLSRLLDPKTLEDKEEARLLAYHIRRSTGGPLTRGQYSRLITRENLRILQPAHSSLSGARSESKAPLTAEEEEIMLEQIILSRRSANDNTPVMGKEESWTQGAEGMGSAGPQCVVCQSSPRTILVWPCRCLSLCEDCRVSLAMNNFGNCVCCRRDVVAFSRLFVP